MGQQPLSLMVRVIRLQWPRLERSSSKTSVYPFMTSLVQGWQQLSDRGCMGDEVCIWRNAEVLTKRCHFPCSIINLPIPSAEGTTAYQQLMWEVSCDQYWERVDIHEFDLIYSQSPHFTRWRPIYNIYVQNFILFNYFIFFIVICNCYLELCIHL